MPLVRVTYSSRPAPGLDDAAVSDILATARRYNPDHGITGFLVKRQWHFAQVLEGPSKVVTPLLGRIITDPRHRDVVLAGCVRIEARRFGRWSMGYLSLTDEMHELLEGRMHPIAGDFDELEPEALTRYLEEVAKLSMSPAPAP